ncbi:uncharacterized protein LOC131658723 [Vicia villosa]|uniref:uncharacterized protein LOC131658723 n=1 Tax=Vicia villosa TaxID=3911 RepID=UPI00273AAF81|nr:uncharacterized protein LOC131658723 [Vicia villosa]
MATKRKLNIGSRRSKDSNLISCQGSNAEETHPTSSHAQGSNAEETRSNPSHVEVGIHESRDSYSIPSDVEAEEDLQINKDVHPKKKRPNKNVRCMDTDSCIIVNLDKYGRLISPKGMTLTRFIASLVRNKHYASIKYKSWKDMLDKEKDVMLEQIETTFEFNPPMNDTTRQMLKFEMNIKWKQWKCDLKSMEFDPGKTEEEVASFVPNLRVDPDQYCKLVHHWFSDKAQKKKKAKGVSPTHKEIYIDSRTRKDGSVVNEKAERFIEKLNKHNNEAETSQSVQKIQSHMPWKDDIYSQVKGSEKRGHKRCIGNIPKPKKSKAFCPKIKSLGMNLRKCEKDKRGQMCVWKI